MKTKISLLIVAIVLISAFRQHKPAESLNNIEIKKGMTKVTVLYVGGEGKTFDWDYYLTKHAPLIKSSLGNSLKVLTIDKGVSGRTPDSPPTYVAMFNMYFENLSAYQNSFGPNAEKIRNDIPNYTNIQPIIQISEVQE